MHNTHTHTPTPPRSCSFALRSVCLSFSQESWYLSVWKSFEVSYLMLSPWYKLEEYFYVCVALHFNRLVATNTFANLFIALWHRKSWCISKWVIFHVYKLAALLVKRRCLTLQSGKQPENVINFSYLQLPVQLQYNILNVTLRLIHAVKVYQKSDLNIVACHVFSARITRTLLIESRFSCNTQMLQKVNTALCNFLSEYYV